MTIRLVLIGVLAVLTACSAPTTAPEPSDETPNTIPPPLSELPADSPGPMEIGTTLAVYEGFPTREDLEAALPAGVFEPGIEGATEAAFAYMNQVSDSFAPDSSTPADVTYLKALSTDRCGWCASHEQLIRDFAYSNTRVTGWVFSDSTRGAFNAGEVENSEVVVEIPTFIDEVRIWNPDGSLNNSEPARDVLFRLQLAYVDGMWQVVGIAEAPL